MIKPPFADHNRAKLERLVREGFEAIERDAASQWGTGDYLGNPRHGPMSPFDFQLLCAAWVYLQTTKD